MELPLEIDDEDWPKDPTSDFQPTIKATGIAYLNRLTSLLSIRVEFHRSMVSLCPNRPKHEFNSR